MPGSTAWVQAIVPSQVDGERGPSPPRRCRGTSRSRVAAGVVHEDVDRSDARAATARTRTRRCRSRRARARPSIPRRRSRRPRRRGRRPTTRAPSAASRRAVAAPMPDAPPVTRRACRGSGWWRAPGDRRVEPPIADQGVGHRRDRWWVCACSSARVNRLSASRQPSPTDVWQAQRQLAERGSGHGDALLDQRHLRRPTVDTVVVTVTRWV